MAEMPSRIVRLQCKHRTPIFNNIIIILLYYYIIILLYYYIIIKKSTLSHIPLGIEGVMEGMDLQSLGNRPAIPGSQLQ